MITQQLLKRLIATFAVATIVLPYSANAAGLSPRSVGLGTSKAGVATTYTVNVTTATANNIGSIKFEMCTTASGACTTPTGLVTTGATVTAQSGAAGFTMVNTNNGAPYINRAAAPIGALVPLSYTLSNITNPTAVNQAFYVRVTTYTAGDGATGAVDTGTIAASTAEQVQLTGVTPEILVFCVGVTITSDCTTVAGSSVDFGDFSPVATRSATSVMQAATNASGGYNITVNGTTLSSGVNTIPALPGATASTIGIGQFGFNLRANTVPSLGSDMTGAIGSLGAVDATYNGVNNYRFNSGDVVATAPAPTNANTYTSSYIVNIGGAQAAGVYTATMTYICTANF